MLVKMFNKTWSKYQDPPPPPPPHVHDLATSLYIFLFLNLNALLPRSNLTILLVRVKSVICASNGQGSCCLFVAPEFYSFQKTIQVSLPISMFIALPVSMFIARQSWGDGGDASPQFLEWEGRISNYPPPTLFNMFNKILFLGNLKT